MERWNESVFRASALASDLVSAEQIDEAVRLLTFDLALSRAGGEASASSFTDDDIAAKLVELGYLNPWQVEQLMAGRTRFVLGDYQIIDCIGQGGMGQVFKAIHTLLGRVEAIKVLPRDKSTSQAIAAFKHEIRAQAQLDHPNLVRVAYAGFDRNVYYLVTEYVPGVDLRQFVRSSGPLTVAAAAAIASQAAAALDYVHSRGLVHRDIKPGNLLVTPDGVCKVSDLGLAGFSNDEYDDPRAGKIVGTADYLAPEQIQNPREIRHTVDIYALGCTLYYAVTGKVPYPGGTTKEKARRHCQDTPLHPRHFNPQLDDAFVELIADMMEKDPAKRVPTAAVVIDRLATWVGATSMAEPAASRSTRREPKAGAVVPPPALHDTDSDVLDFPPFDASREESPSQLTQSTEPAKASSGDTQPMAAIKPRPETRPTKSKVIVPPSVSDEEIPADAVFDEDQEAADEAVEEDVAAPTTPRRWRLLGWIGAIPRGIAAVARRVYGYAKRGALAIWRMVRRMLRVFPWMGGKVRRAAAMVAAGVAAIPGPLKVTFALCAVIVVAVATWLFVTLFK